MIQNDLEKRSMQFKQLGLVGYGEVGKIFSAGFKPQVETVSAWDLKLAQAGVQACPRCRRCAHRPTASSRR